MKLCKIKEHIQQLKSSLRIKNKRKMKTKLLFKTSVKMDSQNSNNAEESKTPINNLNLDANQFNSIEERDRFMSLIEKYKKESLVEVESMTYKTVNNYGLQGGDITRATLDLLNKIKDLESEETSVKANIQSVKKAELDRIFKEYLTNDYERRYKVTKSVVISALIGEDNIFHELVRQAREQRVNFLKFYF
jgi:hypothetical protein